MSRNKNQSQDRDKNVDTSLEALFTAKRDFIYLLKSLSIPFYGVGVAERADNDDNFDYILLIRKNTDIKALPSNYKLIIRELESQVIF
jgi:hypothetical protein